MEKMKSHLCGILLIVVVVVMPLSGMQLQVVKDATNNVELLDAIVEQAHKTVDAALGTFTSADQIQQKSAVFEKAKTELVQLMEKIDLVTIDLNKIDLAVKIKLAQLMQKVDLRTRIKLAQLMQKVDLRTKVKFTQLMKKIDDLDGEAKKAINDAMKTIQINEKESAVKNGAGETAHQCKIQQVIDSAPQGKIQQAIDYVSSSFQQAWQTVSALLYNSTHKK